MFQPNCLCIEQILSNSTVKLLKIVGGITKTLDLQNNELVCPSVYGFLQAQIRQDRSEICTKHERLIDHPQPSFSSARMICGSQASSAAIDARPQHMQLPQRPLYFSTNRHIGGT